MTRTKLQTLLVTATLLGVMCILVGGVRAVDEPNTTSNSQKKSDVAASQIKDVPEGQPGIKTISGRVVDDQDRPVAGAQLWWVVSHGVPDDVVVKKVSDEQGRFSMSTPDVAPLRITSISDALWVLKEGKQLATISAGSLRPRDAKTPDLIVRLEPETDTSFVVQSTDQEPVAGAAVEPWHFRNHQGYAIVPPEIRKILTATTDDEGRVRMPNMPRKGFHTVRTTSQNYGIQELRLDSEATTEAERMIELRPVGSIEGKLTSDDRKWVRGVRLWFSSETQSSGNGWKTEGFATATSDDEGRFVVPAIAQGKLRIDAFVPKDAPVLPRLSESLLINAGVTEELAIALETPVVVRGMIRTEDTDKPIPGAEISVRYGVWRQGTMVTSDSNGKYEARVLAGPVYTQVIARPKEFDSYEQTGTPWNQKFDVSDPTVPFDLPTILLSPTIVVKGKLIDQDGKPLAKKRVNGIFEGRRYGFSMSNEKGEFEMQIPKSITIQAYEVWLSDGQFATPDVDESEALVLRVEVPRE
jgi:protocatechuate 3,4-dioxygenase beta subunit